jgi:hypothetical protein
MRKPKLLPELELLAAQGCHNGRGLSGANQLPRRK